MRWGARIAALSVREISCGQLLSSTNFEFNQKLSSLSWRGFRQPETRRSSRAQCSHGMTVLTHLLNCEALLSLLETHTLYHIVLYIIYIYNICFLRNLDEFGGMIWIFFSLFGHSTYKMAIYEKLHPSTLAFDLHTYEKNTVKVCKSCKIT